MTLDDRLDAVLHRAREPEPPDDGFTEGVMARVRGETNRRWRRYLTRPAILAAAAVLVAGGAFAAVRQDTPDAEMEAADETPVADVRAGASAETAPPAEPPERESRIERSAGTESQDGDERPVHRRDGYEWGYTSEHTSYVLHRDSGLRLEAETHTNAWGVDDPQEVALTLENTSDEPIGVASEGCPLAVFVRHAEEGEGEDPSILRDPSADRSSEAVVRNCAGEGGDERASHEPRRFVLAPGERHVERSLVVLTESGDWAIAANCRCRWTTASEDGETEPMPTPEKDDGLLPLRGSDDPRTERDPASDRRDTRDHGRSWQGPDGRFFTPPIRVEAS